MDIHKCRCRDCLSTPTYTLYIILQRHGQHAVNTVPLIKLYIAPIVGVHTCGVWVSLAIYACAYISLLCTVVLTMQATHRSNMHIDTIEF